MKRIVHPTLWATGAALLMLVPEPTAATDKLNFSGSYVAEQVKKASENESASTLEVVQKDEDVEIIRVELGKKTISRCPLNGTEGDYTSAGGVSGRCKAQLKPKYLIVESVVVTSLQQATSAVRVHTKEKWQLSADAKTLIIKSDVDFPDVPSDISAAMAGTTSGTAKYKRAGP
jgi:hypothetical protein